MLPTTVSPILTAFQHLPYDSDRDNIKFLSPRDDTNVQPNSSQQHNASAKASIAIKKQRADHQRPVAIFHWMIEHSEATGFNYFPSRALKQFPRLLCSSQKANLMKASHHWCNRNRLVAANGNTDKHLTTSITLSAYDGLTRVNSRARKEIRRKICPWVDARETDMFSAFDCLRRPGLKFKWKKMHSLAQNVILNSANAIYSHSLIENSCNKPITECVTRRWIKGFSDNFRIVTRSLTGKYFLSPLKEDFIHREVAFHLGVLRRAFRSGGLEEDNVENADETRCVISMENRTIFALCGKIEVNYADVFSGGEGMVMFIGISGGRDARVDPLFVVFRKKARSYPVRIVPDDIPGVAYITSPNDWMDKTAMPQWFKEERVIRKLTHQRKKLWYIDNFLLIRHDT